MRDWQQFVRARLELQDVAPGRQERMVAELATQLEDFVADGIARGMTEGQADAYAEAQVADWPALVTALRRVGGHRRPAEDRIVAELEVQPAASMRGRIMVAIAAILGDVRYAVRHMVRAPMFTTVAVLTLALGIGANTAIFSVVDGILFRPLPYEHPERLFAIHEVIPSQSRGELTVPVKLPHFQAWRRAKGPFDQLAVLDAGRMTLTGASEPERLSSARVSPSLFAMLGTRAQLGRLFLDEEDADGRDHVVVLSDDLWRRRFNADPLILGRTVRLDDDPYQVVGVLPATFVFPALSALYPITIADAGQPQIWKPFAATAADRDPQSGFNFASLAQLASGVSPAQALSALNAEQAALPNASSASGVLKAALVPLQSQVTERSRTGLTLLLVAVFAVLMIGCVNITNLLLARTLGRRREFAIRSALGAGRGRLAAQLMVESLLLSTIGGVCGILTAHQAIYLIVANAPADLPLISQVRIDGRVLSFALGTMLVTGLLVGLLPVWRLVRVDFVEALKSGAPGNTGASAAGRIRSLLVGLEVGLSTICLVAAGLLLHSFYQLLNVDVGFDARSVVTVDASVSVQRYPTIEGRITLARSLIEGAERLPGVMSAGVASKLPMTGEGGNAVLSPDGGTLPREQRPIADIRVVNPEYLGTMGIPLRAGRLFAERDRGHPVAVVSALTANRLWPGGDAVGKRFRVGPETAPPIDVVGVAGDVRGVSLERKPSLTVYVPYWQGLGPTGRGSDLSLVFRTSVAPLALSTSIREMVRRQDPELPISAFRTMDTVIGDSVSQRRFQTTMVLLFAFAATLLASLGVYGVVSYAVAQRTREMGLRLALGATAAQIHQLVLAQSLVPVGFGLVLGLVIAGLALDRVLGSLLFGVRAGDPITLGVVATVVLVVAVVAIHMPARRATRVDPLTSLRPQ